MSGQDEDLAVWRRKLLEALREDAGDPDPSDGNAQIVAGRVEVLVFRLGEEKYAVDLREVIEILMPRVIVPVPRTDAAVRGVASVRGAVLPVVDLASRLGLHPAEPSKSSRIVVLRDRDQPLGFWVDGAQGVVRFAEEQMEVSGFAAAVDPGFIRGIGYDRSGALVAVLSAAQLCDLELETA